MEVDKSDLLLDYFKRRVDGDGAIAHRLSSEEVNVVLTAYSLSNY